MSEQEIIDAYKIIGEIENPITRRITKLFFDDIILSMIKNNESPPAAFDYKYFIMKISKTSSKHNILRMCLDGIEPGAGWEAMTEIFPRDDT